MVVSICSVTPKPHPFQNSYPPPLEWSFLRIQRDSFVKCIEDSGVDGDVSLPSAEVSTIVRIEDIQEACVLAEPIHPCIRRHCSVISVQERINPRDDRRVWAVLFLGPPDMRFSITSIEIWLTYSDLITHSSYPVVSKQMGCFLMQRINRDIRIGFFMAVYFLREVRLGDFRPRCDRDVQLFRRTIDTVIEIGQTVHALPVFQHRGTWLRVDG